MQFFRNAFFICLLFLTCETLASDDANMPHRVVVGAYINDIQAMDLRNHSYVVDIYVWFRWFGEDIQPAQTFEFMNTFDPEAHIKTIYYDEPVPQPDGSFYNLVRYQGAFSNKFYVGLYPFDEQIIRVSIEDGEMGSDSFVYIADENAISTNPDIRLPGYTLENARFIIRDKAYTTAFGDLSEPDVGAYSRITIDIPVRRPVVSSSVKIFLPVLLIVTCALLALLLDPSHVEARVGLSITALLTLVALQLTAASSLPEVGYLLMLDQLYIASYLFILIVISLVVYATRVDEQGALQGEKGNLQALAEGGVRSACLVSALYLISVIMIVFFNA